VRFKQTGLKEYPSCCIRVSLKTRYASELVYSLVFSWTIKPTQLLPRIKSPSFDLEISTQTMTLLESSFCENEKLLRPPFR